MTEYPILSDEQLFTLGHFCKSIWNDMTEDQREYWYNGTGTIGFVDHVRILLGYENYDYKRVEDLDNLLDDLYDSI